MTPTERPAARWWARRTLRARITLLATLIVALAVAAGGLLAVQVLGYVLGRTVDDGARAQAAEIASLVVRGELPDPLPAFGNTAGVQVVDSAGRVLAASAGGDRLVGLVPSGRLDTVRAGGVVDLPGARLGDPDPLRVVGQAADLDGRQRTVLVAVSFQDVTRSSHLLGLAAVFGTPLAVAAFALGCWLLTGSALRPVSALRQGAQLISAEVLSPGSTSPEVRRPDASPAQRLPVPIARDEIRLLAETLNAMLDRLAVSAVAQRSFVADAAHELRSPLASLRVQLEVERDHPEPGNWPTTAEDLLADVARLDRLVADLLTLARTEQPVDAASSALRDAGPVDLGALAVEVAAEVTAAARGRAGARGGFGATARAGVAVEVEPGTPPPAFGEPDALRRVLTNLLTNAVTHAGSRVLVTVRAVTRPGGAPGVVLVVADDGPGIPAADRARVFDRFTRLDPARSGDAGGAGLGLSIVARLVAMHGGTVTLGDADPAASTAGSAAGPGLAVTVVLPALPGPDTRHT